MATGWPGTHSTHTTQPEFSVEYSGAGVPE